MRIIKLLCICLLFILPFRFAIADQFTDLTLKTISQCYDKYDTIDSEFTQCISNHMKTVDNPDGYRLNLRSEYHEKSKSGKITIFMANNVGFMMYCIATAGPKLIIKSCVNDKGAPLTPGQQDAVPNLLQ